METQALQRGLVPGRDRHRLHRPGLRADLAAPGGPLRLGPGQRRQAHEARTRGNRGAHGRGHLAAQGRRPSVHRRRHGVHGGTRHGQIPFSFRRRDRGQDRHRPGRQAHQPRRAHQGQVHALRTARPRLDGELGQKGRQDLRRGLHRGAWRRPWR